MSISQVSWGRLLKVTPMHSYTHRGHTRRIVTHTDRHTETRTPTGARCTESDRTTHSWEKENLHGC